jgi:hypothetical protein
MPLLLDMRRDSGGGDFVLRDETVPVHEGPSIAMGPILALDRMLQGQAMPATPAAAVEEATPGETSRNQPCAAYPADEEGAIDQGPAAVPAEDGDEPDDSTSNPIAAIAAVFAVALRSYRAINPRTSKRDVSDRSGDDHSGSSTSKRRSGPSSQ